MMQQRNDDELIKETRGIVSQLKSALAELALYTDELEAEVHRLRGEEDAEH